MSEFYAAPGLPRLSLIAHSNYVEAIAPNGFRLILPASIEVLRSWLYYRGSPDYRRPLSTRDALLHVPNQMFTEGHLMDAIGRLDATGRFDGRLSLWDWLATVLT